MLIRAGVIADDEFTRFGDEEALAPEPALVSLKRFLAERDTLLARNEPLGVLLETADTPEALGDSVARLSLIAFTIAHFKDGRAFSWARLLRTRLNFKGEIRVTGHILPDQLAFYARVGVNAFELPQTISLDDFNAALAEISDVYQPSVDGRETIPEMRERIR